MRLCRKTGLPWDEISLRRAPMQGSSGCAAPDSSMTEAATGPTGGSNSTVRQDGVEEGGCTGAGLSGRKRLHGGEDEGQAVCHILVFSTGQSRCVACRG